MHQQCLCRLQSVADNVHTLFDNEEVWSSVLIQFTNSTKQKPSTRVLPATIKHQILIHTHCTLPNEDRLEMGGCHIVAQPTMSQH